MKPFAEPVMGIERSWIREMSVLASRVPDTVSIGQGIPSFDLPEYILDGLIARLRAGKGINRYSLQPGMPELKQACAERVRRDKGVELDPDQEIFISAGAMEGLNSVTRAIIDTGDEVIFPSPTYEPHINLVKMYGGRPVFVPMLEQDGWRMDLDAVDDAVTDRTKAVMVCSPSNPTGGVLNMEEVGSLCEIAIKHDLYLLSDEAYDFLVFGGEHQSPLSVEGVRDRVVAFYSFSKEFAMTGFRVGYVCADARVIEQATKVHDNAVICAPHPSQYAALVALTQEPDRDYETYFHNRFAERRDAMCQGIDELGEFFEYQKPSGAYYMFPRMKKPQKSSKELAMELLNNARVVTIPGFTFGLGGEGHLRFSFAGGLEEIEESFKRMGSYLNEVYG